MRYGEGSLENSGDGLRLNSNGEGVTGVNVASAVASRKRSCLVNSSMMLINSSLNSYIACSVSRGPASVKMRTFRFVDK